MSYDMSAYVLVDIKGAIVSAYRETFGERPWAPDQDEMDIEAFWQKVHKALEALG